MNEEELSKYLEELHSKDESMRNRAVETLSHGDADKIVPHLMKKLRVPQVPVKCAVIKILGELEAKEAVRPLMMAPLVDSDENVRRVTAEALGKIGAKEAVEPLLGSLPHEEDSVKMAIVVALGRLKDNKSIDLLIKELDNPKIRRAAADSLAKIGQDSSDHLVGVIKHTDPDVRIVVLDTLGNIRKENAIEPMIEMLGDTDLKVRNTAIQALAAFGDKKIPYLIKALVHAHLHVRGHASNLLVAYGENVLPALLKALSDEKMEGQKEFVDAIGNVIETVVVKMRNSGRSWEIPPELLKMKNDMVIQAISRIMVLLAMGPEENAVLNNIINLMNTQNEIERRNLCEILHAVVKDKEDRSRIKKLLPYLKEETFIRKSIIETLVRVGELATDPLLEALVDLTNQYQSGIMLTLRAMKSLKALEKLKEMLKMTPDDKMEKLAVIEAMGRMEMPQAVDILTETLSNSSIYIRRETISALGAIGSQDCIDPIQAALEENDPGVRATAAIALSSFDAKSALTPLVKKEKADTSITVRRAARMTALFFENPGDVKNFVEPTPSFAERAPQIGERPAPKEGRDVRENREAPKEKKDDLPKPPAQQPPATAEPHKTDPVSEDGEEGDLSLPPAPSGLAGEGLPPPPGFKKDGDQPPVRGPKVIKITKK